MTVHRTIAAGPAAWLVEPDAITPADYAAELVARDHPAVVEVVPAAATVLVVAVPTVEQTAFAQWLGALDAPMRERDASATVEIPVVYDGADLAEVAATVGRSVAEVIELHAASSYRCAFCGFAPGFGYLEGLDPTLHLPRRATPRTQVPPGSVAVAATYAAVYPSASPGGWHLLGRTERTLWDPARPQPALLAPGTTVRFVPVGP